jgi:flagellar biosynthesis chaperone FliJ
MLSLEPISDHVVCFYSCLLSAVAVRNKDKSEQQYKDVSSELKSLEKQFTEMEKANKKLMEDAHHHNQQL